MEKRVVTMKVTEKTTGFITRDAMGSIAIVELLSILFNKDIVKCKDLKRKPYKYNFSDYQTIEYHNKHCIITFENVPTHNGTLDTHALWQSIVEEGKEAFSK